MYLETPVHNHEFWQFIIHLQTAYFQSELIQLYKKKLILFLILAFWKNSFKYFFRMANSLPAARPVTATW